MSNTDLFNLGKNTADKSSVETQEKAKTFAEQLAEDTSETDPNTTQTSELDMLKQRARLMGLSFSNNIGVEALAAKIQAKLDGDEAKAEAEADAAMQIDADDAGDEDEIPEPPEAAPAAPKKVSRPADNEAVRDFLGSTGTSINAPKVVRTSKKLSLRQMLRMEAMKLVRLRVTNMDPKKANLPGEFFTVANEYIGTVTKYVPFGEATENGYHVPQCIYEQLKARKFLNIRVTKKNGREVIHQNWVKEFALEVLPPLNAQEIARLATAQLASGSLNDD